MSRHWLGGREAARVIWAILAKDLLEVIKNKSTLTALLSALFIVFFYRMLPSMSASQRVPYVRIYDAGESSLTAMLENSPAIKATAGYESAAQMEEALANRDTAELGLVVPAGFDEALRAGTPDELSGYLMYWVTPKDGERLRGLVEDEIANILGQRVSIRIEGNIVYGTPQSTGLGLQAAMAATFLVLVLGITLVPHLMIAERQEHTLEVLLASPAGNWQVAVAKALTGLTYCLLGGAVALAYNRDLVVHWGLAILGLVCFSLFAVSLGLALGTKIETRAQLSLWTWVIITPMFVPVIAVLLEELIPAGLVVLANWFPSTVFLNLWRYAFAGRITQGVALGYAAYLLAWAAAGIGVVAWLLSRSDRGEVGLLRRRVQASTADASVGVDGRVVAEVEAEPGPGAPRIDRTLLRRATVPSTGTAVPSRLGIIATIFAKDLREAFRNRLLLSILLGTAFIVLNGAFLPLLIARRQPPSAVALDPGHSTILRGLAMRNDLELGFAGDREEFETTLNGGVVTWLGLIIPEDFDARAARGEAITLDAQVSHTAKDDEVGRLMTFFSAEIGKAAWAPVSIRLDPERIYPTSDEGGMRSINLTTMMVALGALGVALVPLLMVEEKEAHTLESLLVSPARYQDVILGKGLVGLVYCLLAASVVLLLNQRAIVHWEIAVLAAFFGALFAVAVGMLIGMLAGTPASAGAWGAPILLLLYIPGIVQWFIDPRWPSVVRQILPWMPGSVILRLSITSLAGHVRWAEVWTDVLVLASMTAVAMLLIVWRARKAE